MIARRPRPGNGFRPLRRSAERGQGVFEYALMIALVALVVLAGIQVIGTTTTNALCRVVRGLNGECFAYVADWSNTLTPISLTSATPAVHTAASVSGPNPAGIAVTPDGKTAYLVNSSGSTVTAVNLTTSPPTPSGTINVGQYPNAIAITPDGKYAYTANWGSNNVTQINLATLATTTVTPSTPAAVSQPAAIAISHDGRAAYLVSYASSTVTPINLTTSPPTPGTNIAIGSNSGPYAIAITPDGATAYILSSGSQAVTALNITIAPPTVGSTSGGLNVAAGHNVWPDAIAITPDGKTALVTGSGDGYVYPLSLPSEAIGSGIDAGGAAAYPTCIAITPDGATALIGNAGNNTIAVMSIQSLAISTTLSLSDSPEGIAVS